ncbi:MAG: hypothetical protein WCA20_07450 [Candidatus Sulfotelmatobacter sp.]
MDIERIIDDIQQLEEMFEAPDIRPLSAIANNTGAKMTKRSLRASVILIFLAGFVPKPPFVTVAACRLEVFFPHPILYAETTS